MKRRLYCDGIKAIVEQRIYLLWTGQYFVGRKSNGVVSRRLLVFIKNIHSVFLTVFGIGHIGCHDRERLTEIYSFYPQSQVFSPN